MECVFESAKCGYKNQSRENCTSCVYRATCSRLTQASGVNGQGWPAPPVPQKTKRKFLLPLLCNESYCSHIINFNGLSPLPLPTAKRFPQGLGKCRCAKSWGRMHKTICGTIANSCCSNWTYGTLAQIMQCTELSPLRFAILKVP